jgi:aspartate kinase
VENLIIQKFGGSSLNSPDKFKACAKHILRALANGNKLIVVVSAMGDATDELLVLAKKLSKAPNKRELDMLLTTGERASIALMSICLNELGVKALSLTGSQCGILTDSSHTDAQIKDIHPQRIVEGLVHHDVVVVAGFQGICPQTKDITTLGRGGSDLTAVALAKKLSAKKCEIYTDTQGIMSLDPKLSNNAISLKSLSWQQACNLASSGATVLHERSAYLAQKEKIPLEIKHSTKENSTYTHIGADALEKKGLYALTCRRDQSLYKLKIKKADYSKLMSFLDEQHINLNLFTQELCSNSGNYNIYLAVAKDNSHQVEAHLQKYNNTLAAENNLAFIYLHGFNLLNDKKLIFTISSLIQNRLISLQTHDQKITLLVRQDEFKDTISKLEKFIS